MEGGVGQGAVRGLSRGSCGTLGSMPWLPELFTAPALQKVLDERRRDSLVAVPYFDGLLAGDADPLVESFAGVPEVLDPVRGRVKGEAAFRAFVREAHAWLEEHHATVTDVEHVILERHGFEEVVLGFDSGDGPTRLPIAVVADRLADGRIEEVRVYCNSRVLTGVGAPRSALLQPDPEVQAPDVVREYLQALADGDLEGLLTTFDPAAMLEPDAFYGRVLMRGGITLEPCALVDDGRACLLEYDVVRWGNAPVPPRAGAAVFVRGGSGRLASVRLYDDLEPPRPTLA